MGKVKQSNIKNQTYYFCNDQINWKDFDIYYIGYMTFKKIANCNNINSINPLYLMINEMIGHFEEKNEIRFESNDDLAMNKPIRLHLFTIIIRCVFSESGKFYPQLFLDDALYELV